MKKCFKELNETWIADDAIIKSSHRANKSCIFIKQDIMVRHFIRVVIPDWSESLRYFDVTAQNKCKKFTMILISLQFSIVSIETAHM